MPFDLALPHQIGCGHLDIVRDSYEYPYSATITSCARAAVVPPLAEPLVYIVTSAPTFSVFDLFFAIPIGAVLGLLALMVVRFPVLALLDYWRCNRVWLVVLISFFVGAAFSTSLPVPVWSVGFFYALVGAITGGVASYFVCPDHHSSGIR